LKPLVITAVRAYQVDLPLHEGGYRWAGGKSLTTFDSTVVAVDTDAGVTGWGEVCAGTRTARSSSTRWSTTSTCWCAPPATRRWT
jgi:L-alanine-DL-glutamate epimerase-like enolase superfamily enzyme